MKKTYRFLGVVAAMMVAVNGHASEQQTLDCNAIHQETKIEEISTRGAGLYLLLQDIIVAQLSVEHEQVVMEAGFKEDLGADSLDMYEICITCEETFGICIDYNYIPFFYTVADLYDYILKRLNI